MKTIEINNIAAIKHVSIPIPPGGGLTLLKGDQGTGKTTALNCINALVTGEVSLEKRDGTISGSVSGLGVTIVVKKSTRRSGELEVSSIEGKFSIADLVDPRIADPVAADAKRIKALLGLAGAEADAATFHDLLGGPAEFLRIVGDTKETDILKLASLVKRKAQASALEIERSADEAAGKAKAHREAAAKFDGVEAIDPAVLQRDMESAIANEAALKKSAVQAKTEEARAALAKAEAAYDGATLAEAESANEEAQQKHTAASQAVSDLKQRLTEAETAETAASMAATGTATTLSHVKQHFQSIDAWRQQIDSSAAVAAPDEQAIIAATKKVGDLRQEIERQALVRQAITDRAAAQQADADYKTLAMRGTALRSTADKVDDVLSGLVAKLNCPLRVKDNRIVLDTDRGEELFAELSDGERILHAVPIAAHSMPPEGLLVVEQWLWGELSPGSRKILRDVSQECGINCVAVVATDDAELTAEVFEE